MSYRRPNPDELLQTILDGGGKRGSLKIFLGASAGVGKTYAMLQEAHERLRRGQDIVIGYVESHRRKETEALCAGLEVVPLLETEYRGARFLSLDVAKILERNPEVVLVDELAHTNAPNSRHVKRWQDIEDLVAAGISVFTTVNVQHLASLNDVVAQITGVKVRETVPDAFFERANEIEVIDLPPAELQQRLRDGKVYIQERVEQALDGFFKTSNLTALRELALRRAADSIDAEMQRLRLQQGAAELWPARERIVVCIAPNMLGIRLVREASRIANTTHAEVIAVSVESDRQQARKEEHQEHAREALELARSLNFEVVQLSSHDIVGELVHFAKRRNATTILVGKPIQSRLKEILFGSVVDALIRADSSISVQVITSTPQPNAKKNDEGNPTRRLPNENSLVDWFQVLAAVVIPLALGISFSSTLGTTNIAMLHVLGIVVGAMRVGRLQAIVLSLLSVIAFDFFFVEPKYAFDVEDTRFGIVFLVMVLVGVVTNSLTTKLKRLLKLSSYRERRTASLYTFSRSVAQQKGQQEMASLASRTVSGVFNAEVVIFFKEKGNLTVAVPSESGFEKLQNEVAVATWVADRNEIAGRGTATFNGSRALYLPILGAELSVGVLAIRPAEEELGQEQMQLLETFVSGLGFAVERFILAKRSDEARIEAESEQLRSTLLSSISHDLRTPLTTIRGSASGLLEGVGDPHEHAETIYRESSRLNHQIQNLLDMTRLQAGGMTMNLSWQSPEELVAAALEKTKEILDARELKLTMKGSRDLFLADGLLVEKALVNLLENAAKFTTPQGKIEVTVFSQAKMLLFLVSDDGPGFPPDALGHVFQPGFHRQGGGFGLGLAIVAAIMKLHRGRCSATNIPGAGALVRLEFPLPDEQPKVHHE